MLAETGTHRIEAREDIKRGTVIWRDRAPENPHVKLRQVTADELKRWSEEERETFLKHAWQDEDNLYTGNWSGGSVKQDALNFTNHSCDPNIWFVVCLLVHRFLSCAAAGS